MPFGPRRPTKSWVIPAGPLECKALAGISLKGDEKGSLSIEPVESPSQNFRPGRFVWHVRLWRHQADDLAARLDDLLKAWANFV